MVKTRIIPVLLRRGFNLVKGEGFFSWRTVGLAIQAAKIHQMREVDELIVLDITADEPDILFTQSLTEDCFMPLTIGGGIRSLSDIRNVLSKGADKVSIGNGAIDYRFIESAVKKFGSQAITIAIDADETQNVMTQRASYCTGYKAVDWAKQFCELGVGEILLTSIPRDGRMQGYDLKLIEKVVEAVNIPVVAAGGAGSYQHMAEALKAGAHAVAAGALFLFTDATPRGAAEWLADKGFATRI